MDKSKLRDRLISILDDHAEYILWKREGGEMFSGAINQEESIDEIIELTDSYYLGLIPEKKSDNYKSSYTLKQLQDLNENTHRLAFQNGYNQAIDELRNRIAPTVDLYRQSMDKEAEAIVDGLIAPTKETKND